MINAMMELLREEFAQELPATRKTLASWRLAPSSPPDTLAEMLSLLERFTQAVQTVGMQGLASYLQLIQSFTHELADTNYALNSDLSSYLNESSASNITTTAQQHVLGVNWLGQWVDEVNDYLEKPADGQTVENMVVYLGQCPKKLGDDLILKIAALLLELPQMSQEDEQAEADLLMDVTDEDVALPTEDVDPELLFALLADAPQQLDELEQTVSLWSVGNCTESEMQEALRSAHTLKGSGGIIGLPGIARLAHRLEDILEYAFAGIVDGAYCQGECQSPTWRL